MLFYNLATGLSIPEFMEQYPSANADHVSAVFEFLARRLDEDEDEDGQERCTVGMVGSAAGARSPRSDRR